MKFRTKPVEIEAEKPEFAKIVCKSCNHVNYFVRLKQCPNCGTEYDDVFKLKYERVEE